MEGTHCFAPEQGCEDPALTLPVTEYGHDLGCTVIGGYVYRGTGPAGARRRLRVRRLLLAAGSGRSTRVATRYRDADRGRARAVGASARSARTRRASSTPSDIAGGALLRVIATGAERAPAEAGTAGASADREADRDAERRARRAGLDRRRDVGRRLHPELGDRPRRTRAASAPPSTIADDRAERSRRPRRRASSARVRASATARRRASARASVGSARRNVRPSMLVAPAASAASITRADRLDRADRRLDGVRQLVAGDRRPRRRRVVADGVEARRASSGGRAARCRPLAEGARGSPHRRGGGGPGGGGGRPDRRRRRAGASATSGSTRTVPTPGHADRPDAAGWLVTG